MGDAMRKMAEKAKEKVGPEKISKAAETVGGKINELTGGKQADKVEKGQQMVSGEKGQGSDG